MQFNVYKLECNITGLVYYGSTRQTLNQRLSEHKSKYKSYLKGTRKSSCSSFEVLKNNNYKTTLLETCFNVPHMIERETYYKEHNECVNKKTPCVPGRTQKEWYEDYKEKIAEKVKKKYEKNKEKILEKMKEYHEKNKEYKKEYYEKNKEVIAQYHKKKYEKNKESISEKKKEKYTCECGSTLRKDDKSRHERTIKHQNYLKNLNNTLNK